MAEENIEKGGQVSWNWSSGKPSGEVAEVAKEDEIAIESDKGYTLKKNADPENPAAHVTREGNDVMKRASELDVEEKASGDAGATANGAVQPVEEEKKDEQDKAPEEDKMEVEDAPKQNGEAKTGEKRDHAKANAEAEEKQQENGEKDATAGAEKEQGEQTAEPAAKKKKTTEEPKEKKGRGRPKKSESNGTAKGKAAPTKKRQPKKAATADGQPRRSARLRS